MKTTKSFKYYNAAMLIFFFIFVNHFCACIMYAISYYEYNEGEIHNNMVKF